MDLANFDERAYLIKNPDVAEAVNNGYLPSGKAHFLKYGIKEGRTWTIQHFIPLADDSEVWKSYKKQALFHPAPEDMSVFHTLMEKINNKENFHLARYNDGEWIFMLQIQPYFYEFLDKNHHDKQEIINLCSKLLKIIESSPDYYIGIDSTTQAFGGFLRGYESILKEKFRLIKNLVFGDIFNAATIRLGMESLLEPLRNRQVISVGPSYMTQLKLKTTHLPVPLNNCWRQSEIIENQLRLQINKFLPDQPVIIYSCSFLAKLLIDIFYREFGNKISQLDIGSCIDPWCGVVSRPWHRAVMAHYLL